MYLYMYNVYSCVVVGGGCVCVCACLSVHLFVCSMVWSSERACFFACLFVCLCACLFLCFLACPFVCLSAWLSVSWLVLSARPSVCLYVCIYVCLFAHCWFDWVARVFARAMFVVS